MIEILTYIREPGKGQKIVENKFFRLCVPKECSATINDEGGTIKLADSVVEFAVAEMPVNATAEQDYLKIYKLIVSEYLPDENAEVIIAKQRNGPIGTIELVWLPRYTQFVNMKK